MKNTLPLALIVLFLMIGIDVSATDLDESKLLDSDSQKINPIKSIYFPANSVLLNPKSKSKLRATANHLKENSGIQLEIQGHSDSKEKVQSGLILGKQRANRVKEYLISLGIASSRLKIISLGSKRPISLEQRQSSLKKNSRVNFVIPGKGKKKISKSRSDAKWYDLTAIINESTWANFWKEFTIDPFINTHQFGAFNVNGGLDRSGFNLGARFGRKVFSGIDLGIDYRIGKVNMNRIGTGESELSVSYFGVYLAYSSMKMFDFWGTWFFNVSEEYTNNQILEGNGFSLGIGYKLKSYFTSLPNIKINVEFFRYNIDEYQDTAGNATSISSLFNVEELTGSEFIIGLSFPISL